MSKKTSPSKSAPASATPAPAEQPKMRTLTLLDLDVLPPVRRAAKPGAPMPLSEIEDHIRGFDAKINETTREYQNTVIYDIVGKGLMLLKGRDAHLRQGQRLVETVSTSSKKQAKALAKAEEQAEQGFLGWLEEKFPDQSTRTARNYMNAARNCGLTSDHALEDVEALRQALALHEKKPTDLYRLADALSTPPEPEDLPPVNLVAQVFANSRTALGELRAVKEEMGPDEYESVCTMLREELEAFTGRAWEMADHAPGIDATEHGEVTHAKAVPKPGKLGVEARAQIARAMRERWATKKAAKKGGRK